MEEPGDTAMEDCASLGADTGQGDDGQAGLSRAMDDENGFLPDCPYHCLQLGELITTSKISEVMRCVCNQN